MSDFLTQKTPISEILNKRRASLWVVLHHYSDGSGQPDPITVCEHEADAKAAAAVADRCSGGSEIRVIEVPIWPSIRERT